EIHVLTRPTRIHVFESHPAQLLIRAHADGNSVALQRSKQTLSRSSGHMAIGQCINQVSIRHQAAYGSDVLLTLYGGNYRIAAAHEILWKLWAYGRLGVRKTSRGFDNTNRHHLAVGHIKPVGNQVPHFVALTRHLVFIDPFFDENQNAWTGIGPDLG